jgi:hypothetical protein
MFKFLPLFLALVPASVFATSIGDFKSFKYAGVYELSPAVGQDKFCETRVLTIETGTTTASISLDGLKFKFTDAIFSGEGELSSAVNAKGEPLTVRLKIKSVEPTLLKGTFKYLVLPRKFSIELLPDNKMELRTQDEKFKDHRCLFDKTRDL